LFDPEFNARTIAARRRVTGNPWFKRGTMFRTTLDALRAAAGPLTVREIVDAIPCRQGRDGRHGEAVPGFASGAAGIVRKPRLQDGGARRGGITDALENSVNFPL
jgi:hypothetical protein